MDHTTMQDFKRQLSLEEQIKELQETVECLDCDCAYADGKVEAYENVIKLLILREDVK